eukprot:12415806-Karenia_brevis.AAC.1
MAALKLITLLGLHQQRSGRAAELVKYEAEPLSLSNTSQTYNAQGEPLGNRHPTRRENLEPEIAALKLI